MMQKLLVLMVLLSSILGAAEIIWSKDVASAIALGKKENKPVMLLVSKDGCKWCDVIKADTLSDPKVVARLNSDFISVEGYTNRNEVPYRLMTNGTPGTWFLKEGEPMFQPLMGALPAASYLEALDVVLKAFKAQ